MSPRTIIANLILLFPILASVSMSYAQTQPMKSGLWDVVVTNEITGKVPRQVTTSQFCYSAKDIETPMRSMPPQGDTGMKCAVKDYKIEQGSATWQVSCSGKSGSLSGKTSAMFAPERYEGQASLTSLAAGKSSKVTQTIVAKRISAC